MYNYKELCPNFWENFCASTLPEDGAGTYLDQLMQLNQERHKVLHDKLQLPEGVWKYEEQTETKPRSSYDISTKLLLAALPEEEQGDLSRLFNNKLSSGMKVSKYLSKVQQPELAGRIFPVLASVTHSLDGLYKELPKLPQEMRDPFNLMLNFNVLVQNFYSEVAASQNVQFGISLALPDFLEAANSKSFSSCYTVGGCNERAPFHLGVTSNTFVLYVRSNSGVMGRCWGLLNEDFSQLVVFKPYGFINKDHIASAVRWMVDKISGGHLGEWSEWSFMDSPASALRLHADPGVWSDPVILVLTNRLARDDVLIYRSFYSIQTSPCPICGRQHASSDIICHFCHTKYVHTCVSCGREMFNISSNTPLCSTCREGGKICPRCGKVFPEKMKTCPHCHWDYHCSLCGKTSDVPLFSVGAVHVCRDCKELLLSTECDVCGAHGDMYPYKGVAVCPTCFTYLTVVRPTPPYIKDILSKSHREALNMLWKCKEEKADG